MADDREWERFLAAAKARLGIVELISREMQLVRTGSSYRGPAEMDSLRVFPETNTWHRFSRGVGGDIFSWVMEMRGLSFVEAAKEIAELAGIEMPGQASGPDEDERRKAFRVLGVAAKLMHRTMPRRIRAWVRDQYGFTDDTIDELLIGWGAGTIWDRLRRDFMPEDILASGLFVPRRSGAEPHEFFEDRVVFPYWRGGMVVYMIGRRTPWTGDEDHQRAKYKKLPVRAGARSYISPWISNEVFYNEDAARRKTDELLVTEGVTDCIAAMQAGIPCISPVTTSFRSDDLPKLRELAKRSARVILCNDAEPGKAGQAVGAGLAGAIKTASALWPGIDARIAELPRADPSQKIDVNEFLRARTADDLRAVMRSARRLPEFLVDRIPEKASIADALPMIDDALRAAGGMSELELGALIDAIARRVPGAGKRAIRARMGELQSATDAGVGVGAGSGDDGGGADDADDGNAVGGAGHAGQGARVAGEIHRGRGHYFAIGKDGSASIISSFALTPERRVLADGVELFACHAKTMSGKRLENIVMPAGAWHSRRSLIACLSRISPDLQWTGSDEHVQGLLSLLAAEDVPRVEAADAIGWADDGGHPAWAWPGGIISSRPAAAGDPGIAYVPDGSPLDHRVSFECADARAREVAAGALPELARLNDPAVMLPIMGWFFAAPFREPLMKLLGHFPFLFVWGSQGCGKTSTLKLMARMFGFVGDPEPFSAAETEFSMLRLLSGTNGVPIWLDEYKHDMGQRAQLRLHRFLRRVYGGERESRGRADQSVKSYRLQAPVVVAGESRFEEPALVERAIIVSPRKGALDRPGRAESFAKLWAMDLGALAGPYVRSAIRADVRADLVVARELSARWLGGRRTPMRVADNIAAMIFGLVRWERFAEEMGAAVPDIEPMMGEAIAGLLDEVTPAGASRDDLDRFLESCAALAAAKHLEEGRHYVWADGQLWLHVPSAYQAYLERRRAAGLGDETNGLRALRRMAAENRDGDGYVIAISERRPINGRQARCLGIDPDRVPDELDLDGFGKDLPGTPAPASHRWKRDDY